MPLTKIQFTPGIVTDTTNYTASGGWWACDKIRFRLGMPEKIGGWTEITAEQFIGTCRYLHQWSNQQGDQQYLGLGTSSKLYILWGQSYYDITPIKQTMSLQNNPIYVVGNGSNLIYILAQSNEAQIGDYVQITGATGVDVFTPEMINQTLPVTGYFGPNTDFLEFAMPVVSNNPNTISGGGSSVVLNIQISPGLDDATVGQGWGIPPWGGYSSYMGPYPAPSPPATGWGIAFDPTELNPVDPTVNQLRLWSLDNFGEDLVANIRNGPIYYWHAASGLNTPAADLTQEVTVGGVTFTPDPWTPTSAIQALVSPNDRHLIVYGSNDYGETDPNPLLVRWSDTGNAYVWTPLRTNAAGSQQLSAGSYIICALRTVSGQILIWTDLGLWLQQYIGMPYVFGFQPLAQGLSIIGPNAMVNAAGNVFWMDHGLFEVYSGGVQELPCSVKDYVFSNINYTQSYKIYAGHNHAFHEVVWFYPSASATENDSYVTYNYADQLWSFGAMQRTAWLERGPGNYPIAADRDNHLTYFHEYGEDANGAALPAWIESADLDLDGGDHYLYMSRFVPDVSFRGSAAAAQQAIGVTIYGRSEPLKPKKLWTELTVTPMTGQQFIRVRDRQVSFRFWSDALGLGWRLGTIRSDMQPDGRR